MRWFLPIVFALMVVSCGGSYDGPRPAATPTATATAIPTPDPTALKAPDDYCWKVRADTQLDKGWSQGKQRWYLFTDDRPEVETTERWTVVRVINARVDPPGKGNSHYFAGEFQAVIYREHGALAMEKRAHCGPAGD